MTQYKVPIQRFSSSNIFLHFLCIFLCGCFNQFFNHKQKNMLKWCLCWNVLYISDRKVLSPRHSFEFHINCVLADKTDIRWSKNYPIVVVVRSKYDHTFELKNWGWADLYLPTKKEFQNRSIYRHKKSKV